MARDFFNGSNPTAIEMLSYIDENFFKRVDTKRKLMNFTRAFLDKFCEERNLAPVTLTSVEYKYGHYATYMHYSGQLKVNNLLVKSFAEFKEKNNFFYVQEYFDTILHELRHHEQFVGALKDAHPIVKNTMQIMRRFKGEEIFDSHSYFFNPVELDARHFAYKTLKSNAKVFEPYYKHEDYVEFETTGEIEAQLDYVALLKDPDLRGLKLVSKQVKEIEESVKEIALKNKLSFVGIKERPEIETKMDEIENLILSSRVNAEIAPEFYRDEFVLESNTDEIEAKISEEKAAYTDFLKTLAEKDRIRRKNRRIAKKEEKQKSEELIKEKKLSERKEEYIKEERDI